MAARLQVLLRALGRRVKELGVKELGLEPTPAVQVRSR
jgi:hypothetical protein